MEWPSLCNQIEGDSLMEQGIRMNKFFAFAVWWGENDSEFDFAKAILEEPEERDI